MATRLVQYRVKPDGIAENERLVRDVLAQLGERRVSDVRYAVLRGSDGTFTHIVESDANGSTAAITSLPLAHVVHAPVHPSVWVSAGSSPR
jgi:hypothetical protein